MTETVRKPFERNPDRPEMERWSHANGGSGLTRHGRCGKVWWQSGNYTSHCGQCCRTFTSLAGFDAHHEHVDGVLACHDPAEMVDESGRLRFSVEFGVHTGETVDMYWRLLSSDERGPVGPGIHVVAASQGVPA